MGQSVVGVQICDILFAFFGITRKVKSNEIEEVAF